MKVFVVEDAVLISKRILIHLESIPEITEIDSVDSGTNALGKFCSFLPDLVILDIALPNKNGIELLKEFIRFKPDLIVFMFTSYPYHQYKTACIDLGAKEFFDKSRDFELMISKIEDLAKQYSMSKKNSIMSKILVVDDSSIMRKMVIASLKAIPETIFTEASNGLEAIEQLSLQRFDAITLDMNMPDINGLEVLQFIRSQLLHLKIPVIVLTTIIDENMRNKVTQAGATLYLNKPFDPKILAEKVEIILKQSRHV